MANGSIKIGGGSIWMQFNSNHFQPGKGGKYTCKNPGKWIKRVQIIDLDRKKNTIDVAAIIGKKAKFLIKVDYV